MGLAQSNFFKIQSKFDKIWSNLSKFDKRKSLDSEFNNVPQNLK
jgi:hypothetical protein